MSAPTFDAHAADYDAVADSALGRELRARVRDVVGRWLKPDIAVADLGCGTGLDCEWLAPQVARVVAIDSSSEMIEHAVARCAGLTTTSFLRADAATWLPPEPVDLVLANFGVVNCVGPLADFGRRLHSMLTPNGHAVVVSMTKWCPIELAIALAGRNPDLLRRRHGATDSDYDGLDLRYASAGDLAAAFNPRLELVHAESLGLTLPPFEQRRWVEGRAKLRDTLARLDRASGRVGARLGIGDHHIAVFRAVP